MVKKKTKIKEQINVGKCVRSASAISPNKAVKISEQTGYDMLIGWNFHIMDSSGSFKCSLADLQKYQKELSGLEKYTVRQVLEKEHNHPLPYSKISETAKNRLNALNLDFETLFQLNLGTPVRLWGFFDQNIFQILWLDPDHKVYKA